MAMSYYDAVQSANALGITNIAGYLSDLGIYDGGATAPTAAPKPANPIPTTAAQAATTAKPTYQGNPLGISDQAIKDKFFNEFNGDINAMYNYAYSNEISGNQLDSIFGNVAGSANQWAADNNKVALTGTPSATSDLTSATAQQYYGTMYDGIAQKDSPDLYNNQINNLYQSVLGRTASQAELNSWINGDPNATIGDLKANFMSAAQAELNAKKKPVVQQASESTPTQSSTAPQQFTTNELKVAAITDKDNPLVRQAMSRARQAFAGRGLLNSSMAEQAAQEAAISKALEIAAPDTAAYYTDARDAKQFDYSKSLAELGYAQQEKMARLNSDLSLSNAQADYKMRVGDTTHTNYLTMIDRIQSDATKQVQQINSSAMPYEEKEKAIKSIQAQSQASIANSNELFKTMNGWQSEWAVASDSYGWNVEAPTAQASVSPTTDNGISGF